MKNFLVVVLAVAAGAACADEKALRERNVAAWVQHADRTWQRACEKPEGMGSRDLFTAALEYCEAGTNLTRLEKFFDLATEMQDRNDDPKNKNFGNFLWYYNRPPIVDRNAVDFCMQGGAPIWILHRDRIPQPARDKLKKLLEFGIEGCKRHRVGDEYTNIALMNLCNLILLGEGLERPDAVEEGMKRLDSFVTTMRRTGTHEYCSPTYYGVDLEDLVLLEALTKNENVRAVARRLLEYFWTDIALNWFPASQKIGGTRSRDYDYLRGIGMIEQHLLAEGWLPEEKQQTTTGILVSYAKWHPPAQLRELAESKLPRTVTQIWGANTNQSRTHLISRDVSLSVSGAGYGGWMDFPLCVDLAGGREEPRCIFVPDGRHDPYGKNKILEGGSGHMKSLHLSPWWAAAQRKADALGLVVYRPSDVRTNMCVTGFESHFVMPLRADEFWIGNERATVATNASKTFELPSGQALVLRRGTAAVGVRVPWARSCEGKPVRVQFVSDGFKYGVGRLTVDHGTNFAAMATNALPGASFWVRTGSELKDDAAFEKWRTAFAAADCRAVITTNRICITANGGEGPLFVFGGVPFRDANKEPASISPAPPRHLLAIDGNDLGKRILDLIQPVVK